MKKLFLLFTVTLFFLACNNGDEKYGPVTVTTFYAFSDSTISQNNDPGKTLTNTVSHYSNNYHTGSLIDSFYVFIDSSYSKLATHTGGLRPVNMAYWYTDSTIVIK